MSQSPGFLPVWKQIYDSAPATKQAEQSQTQQTLKTKSEMTHTKIMVIKFLGQLSHSACKLGKKKKKMF